MLKHRIIPCLLLSNGGLVKTLKFKEPKYVGDPINAIRIFNYTNRRLCYEELTGKTL
jgi:cyclase